MESKVAPDIPQKPVMVEPEAVADTEYSTAAGRARRRAALKKVAGIWAHREDLPADALEYERELRG